MRVPTIHLNGTSRERLTASLEAAATLLHAALAALAETAPNARDYYPQGDGAFEDARKEHEIRVALVEKARREIVDLWEAIEDAP
jgi:hypothetical protein